MPELRPVSLGVIGNGKVAHDLVCDVLNDQFSFGREDEEGYFAASDRFKVDLLVPCSDETGAGVDAVWQWAMRCELDYRALVDATESEFTGPIVDNVMDESRIIHADMEERSFVELLADMDNPMLLVISGADGVLDATAESVAAQALAAQIPVFDVARALLEIEWRHLPNHEEPAVEVELVEEAGGQLALVMEQIGESEPLVLAGTDVTVLKGVLDQVDEFLGSVEREVLEQIAGLRKGVVLGRSVLNPRPEPAPAGARQYLEVYNEETQQWEKQGRGRPKEGAPRRYVPSKTA